MSLKANHGIMHALKLKNELPDDEFAEDLCILILTWLASHLDLMGRFLKLTGFDADLIRGMIGHRNLYAGLTGFLINHEPTLIAFCEENDVSPAWVCKCHAHFADAP